MIPSPAISHAGLAISSAGLLVSSAGLPEDADECLARDGGRIDIPRRHSGAWFDLRDRATHRRSGRFRLTPPGDGPQIWKLGS